MSETSADSMTHNPPAPVSVRRGRWPAAVAAASLVGLPIAWLLSYASLLLFFLGLFYFILFGLLLGAVLFRIAAPDRPLPKRTLVFGAIVVTLFTWSVSILVEAYDFPHQMAELALDVPRLPEGADPAGYRRASAEQITAYLRAEFSLGFPLGYLQWALTDSRIEKGVGRLPKAYVASQYRWWWGIRVVLSIALLCFGIYSQVAALAKPPAEKPPSEPARTLR